MRQESPAQSLKQLNRLMREIADVCDKIGAEIEESNVRRCHNQHDAKQSQVHQVDEHKREKSSVIAQVGLFLDDHPTSENEMERPGCADQCVEQTPIPFH